MRFPATSVAILTIASCLIAQEQQKPYTEGDVDGFLQRARSKDRSAVVLFNFNLRSG